MMELNKMIDLDLYAVEAQRENFQTWRVSLCHGTPDEWGVVVDTVYVTKKWERVEAVMNDFRVRSESMPKHDHGEWYITVAEVAEVAVGVFTMQAIESAHLAELEDHWAESL